VYVTHDQEEALSLADRLVVLRDGRVQQVGSPEGVYTSPTSAYVAGFMGYRTMLELKVESVREGRAQLRGPSFALEGVCRTPALGSPAVAAVRPEDFRVGASGPNQLAVRVEVVEYHGREQAVEARLADGGLLALRTSARLAPGDDVTVSVAPDRVLVFPAGGPESRAAAEPAGEQAPAIGSQMSQPSVPPAPMAGTSRP
jgi:putative spermidine/putrescine transport system ATP-binding protein